MVNKGFKYRDVSFEVMTETEYLAIACDISASIGYKPDDVLEVDPRITSAYSLRVAMLELLAVGAEPFLLVSLCGNEWEDTGLKFYEGIRSELALAGYSNLPINGSTEENMMTTMSSIGVTLLGKVSIQHALIRRIKSGQHCYQCGYPYLGPDVLTHREEIPTYDDVRYLHSLEGVSEIVPIGSKGALNEARQTADANAYTFEVLQDETVEQVGQLTAGPATSLLVVGDETIKASLEDRFTYVIEIGQIK